MTRAMVVALVCLSGCGGPQVSDQTVSRLYGAVVVRQYESGAHPGALLMAIPVPASEMQSGLFLPNVAQASASQGACTLTLPPDCAAPCGADDPRLIDGGPIHVRGGSAAPKLDLVFDPAQGVYAPISPFDPGGAIFAGGDQLEIFSDGSVAPPFRGSLLAPAALEVTGPEEATATPPVTITWVPAGADRIAIDLVASNYRGEWGRIHCEVADGDGAVTLPESLLAALPRTPRDLELVVSRDAVASAPSIVAGEGVLLQAGFSVVLVGHDW